VPLASGQALSVNALFAEREAAEHLRQREEEPVEFRKRLNNFRLTDEIIESGLDRIKRAFARVETELKISSFPSSFCADDGCAIINASVAPINKPSEEEAARLAEEPHWLLTLPAGVHPVYDHWKQNLEPGDSVSPLGLSVTLVKARRRWPIRHPAEERFVMDRSFHC
jgi:hypothetical protein